MGNININTYNLFINYENVPNENKFKSFFEKNDIYSIILKIFSQNNFYVNFNDFEEQLNNLIKQDNETYLFVRESDVYVAILYFLIHDKIQISGLSACSFINGTVSPFCNIYRFLWLKYGDLRLNLKGVYSYDFDKKIKNPFTTHINSKERMGYFLMLMYFDWNKIRSVENWTNVTLKNSYENFLYEIEEKNSDKDKKKNIKKFSSKIFLKLFSIWIEIDKMKKEIDNDMEKICTNDEKVIYEFIYDNKYDEFPCEAKIIKQEDGNKKENIIIYTLKNDGSILLKYLFKRNIIINRGSDNINKQFYKHLKFI